MVIEIIRKALHLIFLGVVVATLFAVLAVLFVYHIPSGSIRIIS